MCMPAGKNDTGSGVSGVTLRVDMVNRDFASGGDDAWAYGNKGDGQDVGPLAGCGSLGCNGGGGLKDIEAGRVLYHYNGLHNVFANRKIGIQATPMVNPDDTFQGVALHIPWDHPTCAVSSPVLTIDPVQVRRLDALLSAEHMANHPALFGCIDYRENQVCDKTHSALAGVEELVSGVARMPLRKAMSACATLSECGRISVFDPPTPTTDSFATEFNTSALHDVHFCKTKPIPRVTKVKNVMKIAGGSGENVWCGGPKWSGKKVPLNSVVTSAINLSFFGTKRLNCAVAMCVNNQTSRRLAIKRIGGSIEASRW